MVKQHWDVLIYHDPSQRAEALVQRLKQLIGGLSAEIGEEAKVASTAEHFTTGCMFESMEDALGRCSWMFILITEDLLADPVGMFHNNTALTRSICDQGDKYYVPIYENREKMRSLNVKPYIKSLMAVYISDLETSTFARTGMVNNIKGKLIHRKERERMEQQKQDRRDLAGIFKRKLDDIRHEFETKKLRLQGAADIEALRQHCAVEIQQIARDQNIEDLDGFLTLHKIDVSFATGTSDFGSGKFNILSSAELSLRESGQRIYQVDQPGRVPVEHDDCIEDDEMTGALSDSVPPGYATASTFRVGHESGGDSIRPEQSSLLMSDLKAHARSSAVPADQRPDVVGRASPLTVPLCGDNMEPPALLPKVLDDFHSITSFRYVPRSLGIQEPDVGSMVAECSDTSAHETPSLLGSQSQANLTEFDEDSISQFSKCDSGESGDEEMDVGENQVDLSLLDLATGSKPLSYSRNLLDAEGDDESMVVEVDSTAGDAADNTALNDTPTATPFKEPPMRVMHRSYHADDDDDFDIVQPLEIDVAADGPSDMSQLSPGLGELVMSSWPRRRGSDAGHRNPYKSNLTTARFLSLSSIQSLSSKLFRLHQHPSLNNISEWGDRPRLLDGIRPRYAW